VEGDRGEPAQAVARRNRSLRPSGAWRAAEAPEEELQARRQLPQKRRGYREAVRREAVRHKLAQAAREAPQGGAARTLAGAEHRGSPEARAAPDSRLSPDRAARQVVGRSRAEARSQAGRQVGAQSLVEERLAHRGPHLEVGQNQEAARQEAARNRHLEAAHLEAAHLEAARNPPQEVGLQAEAQSPAALQVLRQARPD